MIEFIEFINSLYPTIKFTLVNSPILLNFLDPALSLVEGYTQTDYSKPTENHINLLCNSAHPAHCTKATPFGVATRVKRNCSIPESFEKQSIEYQNYLINRGYNPNKVRQQFDKVRSIPRENLLAPTTKESNKMFPLILNYNPNLPNIGKILHSYKHLIYDSPSLAKNILQWSIIPWVMRPKNIQDILSLLHKISDSSSDKLFH